MGPCVRRDDIEDTVRAECRAKGIAGKSLLRTEKFAKSPIERLGRSHLQQTPNDCICPDDKLTTQQ